MSAFRLTEKDGVYYKKTGLTHFYRYSPFGNLSLCAPVSHGIVSEEAIDLSLIKLYPLRLINTFKALILDSQHNRKVIRDAVANCDAVIAYVPSNDGYYAQRLAKQQNKPCLLIAIGCPWDAYWNHGWKGKLMAPTAYLSMKKSLRNATHTIYVTEKFLQNRYPTNGSQMGISNVILNDIPESVLNDRLNKISSYDFTVSSEIKLGTCAAIDVKYKGQDDVIKAISKLKNKFNIHYYLAGRGNDSYLRSVARKYNVLDRIHFLGPLDWKGIKKVLTNIDIYIQPSKQEGLPRSVIEAMSFSVPCLGSTTGGIPELLPKECIFKKGNISDIVEKINSILDKQKLRELATINKDKSKSYDYNYLEKTRNDYLKEWLTNSFQ